MTTPLLRPIRRTREGAGVPIVVATSIQPPMQLAPSMQSVPKVVIAEKPRHIRVQRRQKHRIPAPGVQPIVVAAPRGRPRVQHNVVTSPRGAHYYLKPGPCKVYIRNK
jgi:hypothetical protein